MRKWLSDFFTPPDVYKRKDVPAFLSWLAIRAYTVLLPFNLLDTFMFWGKSDPTPFVARFLYVLTVIFTCYRLYKVPNSFYKYITFSLIAGLFSMNFGAYHGGTTPLLFLTWVHCFLVGILIYYSSQKTLQIPFTIGVGLTTFHLIYKTEVQDLLLDKNFKISLGFSLIASMLWLWNFLKFRLKVGEQVLDHLEAEKQAATTLSRMISHDIRNPLTVLTDALSMLEQSEKTNPLQIERAKRSCQRILSVVNVARNIALLESKKYDWSLEPVSVRKILFDSVRNYSEFADKKEIQITFPEENRIENLWVLGIEDLITNHILSNVLSNAIKFSNRKGSIRLWAEAENDWVSIYIADSGAGIPKEIAKKIFEIESGISREGTEGETGTGLGLSLAKKFVEKLGGSIEICDTVESDQPKNDSGQFQKNLSPGTTIKLVLKQAVVPLFQI